MAFEEIEHDYIRCRKCEITVPADQKSDHFDASGVPGFYRCRNCGYDVDVELLKRVDSDQNSGDGGEY